MCELLGMSANVPTDIRFSFSGLMERGGGTGPHGDGWGIAFYEGNGCRAFHDPGPSANSEIARMVRRYPIKSRVVVCHIRRATTGRVCLENTHPFTRELWGRTWAFAHNGRLKGIKRWPLKFYKPIGTTDSEYAFCWILDQLRVRYSRPPKRARILWRAVRESMARVNGLGSFNVLLSDSQHLYAHCSSKLAWLTRRAPFGKASLIDTELTVDFSKAPPPPAGVPVIATRPWPRDESWTVMERASLTVFRHGLPVEA